MNTIVTGGAGFIGRHVMEIADDAVSRDLVDGFDIRYSFDVLNPINKIIHLAAISGIADCEENRDEAFITNVVGTHQMLEVARDENAHLIFASSGSAKNPQHFYGATKAAGEALCSTWNKSTILRLGNVYGPGSAHKNSVVAKFCKDAITKGEIEVAGCGKQRRNFCYVKDVARLFCELEDCGTYQVTGTIASINDVADCISNLSGCKVINNSWLDGGVKEAPYEKKLESIETTKDLWEGIKETWEWFNEHFSR